ncbi:MAG: hypothetical protein R3C24_14680 [Cyanobacteriota/Melainabacteria group bacterium]
MAAKFFSVLALENGMQMLVHVVNTQVFSGLAICQADTSWLNVTVTGNPSFS